MPARIRLQRKGTRNNPYWMLIASSNRRNPKGFAIERLGYWFPERRRELERRILINRPRIKYWLSIGAQPTKGVIAFLAKAEFIPPRPPPMGISTLYPKPEKTYTSPQMHPRAHEFGPRYIQYIDEIEERERKIDEAKKMQQDNARAVFGNSEAAEEAKKDLTQAINKFSNYLEAIQRAYPSGTTDQKAALMNFVTGLEEGDDENARVDAKDLAEQIGVTVDVAEKIIATYESIAVPFTKADVQDIKNLPKRVRSKKELIAAKGFIPLKKTVTPVPEFGNPEYDEMPFQLFNIRNELKPAREWGARILPRQPKELKFHRKTPKPEPFRAYHTILNPFFLNALK
ncbi:unnamed protein product [Blepharisma stoltei]|uniref:30S ribosomal protein S16, chloroplastic n=1 Tax=Blepharisma stoltei TaxID=1481888 RepID=A0AAU9K3C6_9CILI|nr:unnamed protein product [Blepharisma stoltei]